MFSRVATSTEREQILERVRPLDGMVNGEAPRRAAAHAAVSVMQSRRSSQPLPSGKVELGARRTRALGSGTAWAAAARAGGEKSATAWTEASQHHALLKLGE
jgi:hypothetical protein